MARIVPIRITKNDKAEYNRLVKNTKAKIKRNKDKYGIDLSSEVEIPKLGHFTTRKELNDWKATVENFTNKANLDYQFVQNVFGVVASKKELQAVKQATRRAQQTAKKMIREQKSKPVLYKGEQISTQGQRMQMMGKEEAGGITVPPDFDFNKMRTLGQMNAKKEAMDKRNQPDYFDRKMLRMQLNFEDIISLSFNDDGDELIKMIDKLSPREFWELYQLFPNEFDFDLYDSEGNDTRANDGTLRRMEGYIEQFNEGKEKGRDLEPLEKMKKHITDFFNGDVDTLDQF